MKNEINRSDGLSRSNTYPFQANGGYIVHPITGDSIEPLVNSLGDTVPTGVIFGVNGRRVNPDSIKAAIVKSAGVPLVINPNTNLSSLGTPKLMRVSITNSSGALHNSLLTLLNDDSLKGFLTNQSGFFKVGSNYPKPEAALPPRYKDNATSDIQYIDIDQGMSSSYVYDILADSRGNIWFATNGGGVSLYDGVSFRHFTENNGMSNNRVRAVIEDRNANLWFGTYGGGLTRYDGEAFFHYNITSGLNSNIITSILEDSRGDIWFGTNGGGVGLLFQGKQNEADLDSLITFSLIDGLNDIVVNCITEDEAGNIWLGTARRGATRISFSEDGASVYPDLTHYDFGNGASNDVRAIIQDFQGDIWFGTYGGGLIKLRNDSDPASAGERFLHYGVNQGITSNFITALKEDRRGDIWIGTIGGGVNQLQSGYRGTWGGEATLVRYTTLEGLSNNNIRALMEDDAGSIWVGSEGGGVCRIKINSFIQIQDNDALNSHLVRAIAEDRHGRLWLGNGGKGLTLCNGSTFENYGTGQGLASNDVRALSFDQQGNLWVGTFDQGVSRVMLDYSEDKIRVKTIANYSQKEGLSHHIIRSAFSDSKGNIWFGTYGGGATQLIPAPISRSGKDEFIHFTEKEGMCDNVVWMVTEDSKGNIWFATNKGATRYDGNSFMHITPAEGLPHPVVRSVVEDLNGNIWFGTFGGMALLRGDMFTCYSMNEGLSHNYVLSVVIDDSNQVWVATERGLNKIPYYSAHGLADGIHYIPYSFGKLDGMKGVDHHQNSVWIDRSNTAWWGSGKGLQRLDLNNFRVSAKVPIPSLKHLEVNEEFIDFRSLMDNYPSEVSFGKVEAFANYPLYPSFRYDQNHLTFHFSAVNWASPHKIFYSYRIVGLNNSWSRPGIESKADYRNIPNGTYTFQLRAIGENRQWSEPFNYNFTILPPWWRTWWFYLSLGAALVMAVLGIFRWRLTQLRIQKKLLEEMVEEKNIELLQQNEALIRLNDEQHILNTEMIATNEELSSANKDLYNQREELEQTLSSLQKAQNQLIQSEKMASLGVLSAGVAHEINNPLNFIQAGIIAIEQFFNENLKEHLHEVKPLIDGIQTGIGRTSKIVASLNHYSRQNHEQLTQCNIHQIIDNCLTILQNQTKGRVEICKEYSIDQPIIEGNESKLHQVFLNILANAIQAIEQNGIIVISTVYENENLKILFQDSGSGINPEHISRITDPFFTTKEPGKGTGLGLSISLSIIREHGGNLEFQSEPEEGASVIITLPLKE